MQTLRSLKSNASSICLRRAAERSYETGRDGSWSNDSFHQPNNSSPGMEATV